LDNFAKKYRQARIDAMSPSKCPVRFLSLTGLQFLLHGVRRVLSLFARTLNVFPETVNRVASHVRA
jgi:hypothetical protein